MDEKFFPNPWAITQIRWAWPSCAWIFSRNAGRVVLSLVLPGMISGGLFAFITSFDEVVIVLFLAGREQYTITRQMFSGIREQISPTILAVATVLVIISIMLLTTLELLRRRTERMRGIRTT